MTEESPAVIIINREKLHKMLHQYTADQWDAAADYIEESRHWTKEELANSIREVAQAIREKSTTSKS